MKNSTFISQTGEIQKFFQRRKKENGKAILARHYRARSRRRRFVFPGRSGKQAGATSDHMRVDLGWLLSRVCPTGHIPEVLPQE